MDRLTLADAPEASSIRWAGDEPHKPKVPVEVSASGPRVISIAARQADRVMLAVGADPKRIAWGIDTAREAARNAGQDPNALSIGAYVNVVCHDDPAVGRELGRPTTGAFARFSAMYGEVAGPTGEGQADVLRRVHDRYDMNAHGQQRAGQITALTDDFIDDYAIVGPPDYCADRLTELGELGVKKFVIIGPNAVVPTGPGRGGRRAVLQRGAASTARLAGGRRSRRPRNRQPGALAPGLRATASPPRTPHADGGGDELVPSRSPPVQLHPLESF